MSASDKSEPAPRYIRPPNLLLARVGRIQFSEAEIAAAEASVASVATARPTLIAEQVDALCARWQEVSAALTADGAKACFTLAHDLTGYGETFGFPMVTNLSRSLCRFLRSSDIAAAGARDVIDAHVSALRIVMHDRMTGNGGEAGKALVLELDRVITKFESAHATGHAS